MRRFVSILLLTQLLFLGGCGDVFTVFDRNTGQAPPQQTEVQPDVEQQPQPQAEEPERVYTGRDHIFYDNSQTVFSFTHSPQYISVIHALMQAEALRDPAAYTLQIANGEIDKENKLLGDLHWQATGFDTLRTAFADRNLYTFEEKKENGVIEIPKLQGKGPLRLLFEDGLLDGNNLSIVVTDLMENGFGLTELASRLVPLLESQSGMEAALYGFQCENLNGNLSFPDYNADGSVVKTVLGYRGIAPMYILALGPVGEVEAFDSRLTEIVNGTVSLERVTYINSDMYTGDSGIGDLEAVRSLYARVKGGNSESLNYTVNAELLRTEAGGFHFGYTDHTTAGDARKQVQLSLMAPLTETSPFLYGGLEVANIQVERVDKKGNVQTLDADGVEICIETAPSLPAWKEGYGGDPLEPVSENDTLLLRTDLTRPDRGETLRIAFDLVTGRESFDWVDRYNASIYEYHSLSDILPKDPRSDRWLQWQAGATDILTRTVGLKDFDTMLSGVVPPKTVVRHIELTVSR